MCHPAFCSCSSSPTRIEVTVSPSGIVNEILVPLSLDSILMSPSNWRTRSRMPRSPTPEPCACQADNLCGEILLAPLSGASEPFAGCRAPNSDESQLKERGWDGRLMGSDTISRALLDKSDV